jgi:hypothetical protein
VELTNNLIVKNTAVCYWWEGSGWGGGIYCNNSSLISNNNTISDNSCEAGGGIVASGSQMTIINCIVWGNDVDGTSDIYSANSVLSVFFSDIRGGWEGSGNIDLHPLFLDPLQGDYNYCQQSICYNNGDPSRTDPDGSRSDIGMYRPDRPDCPMGYKWYVSASGDDSTGDGSSVNPYRTIQYAINRAWQRDTVIVLSGTYHGGIIIDTKNISLVSNFIYSLDWADIRNTVLDGDLSSSVNSHRNCDSTSCDGGFTIQNGSGPLGGGLFLRNTKVNIFNNIIKGNEANSSGGYGGGIYADNSKFRLENCIIANNSALNFGGGIICNYSDPIIINNTIVGNTGHDGSLFLMNSSPIITNNIIWQNTDPQISSDRPLTISYCDIQGGCDGPGNIYSDPVLIDPLNGNYNICLQSPCIDAGDPDIIDPDSGRSDIGCYFPEHLICDLGNKWYVSLDGSDLLGDGTIESPFRTIQHAIGRANYLDSVLADSGIYRENLIIQNKRITVASYFVFNYDTTYIRATIIDGDSTSPCIIINFADSTNVIGLSIMNGRTAGLISNSSITNVSYNLILDNMGGGLDYSNSNGIISHNIIINNWSFEHGGGVRCYRSSPIIANNLIVENKAPYRGGGIACFASTPLLMGNTITRNGAPWGGGFYSSESGNNVNLVNNIIWGNDTTEVYLGDSNPVIIRYCDIEGGWPGEGNINANPLFCDTAQANFWLAANSPCVGAGYGGVDIGAYGVGCEAQDVFEDIIAPGKLAILFNYPNPFNAQTTIRFSLPKAGPVALDIYDILGRRMGVAFSGMMPAGENRILWDGAELPSGAYFYRVAADGAIKTGKMTLVK